MSNLIPFTIDPQVLTAVRVTPFAWVGSGLGTVAGAAIGWQKAQLAGLVLGSVAGSVIAPGIVLAYLLLRQKDPATQGTVHTDTPGAAWGDTLGKSPTHTQEATPSVWGNLFK